MPCYLQQHTLTLCQRQKTGGYKGSDDHVVIDPKVTPQEPLRQAAADEQSRY